MREEYVSEKIKPTSDIERAHEVKYFVLTFQYVPAWKIIYYVLCGQSCRINEATDFNRVVTYACEEPCKEEQKTDLLNCSRDGVSVDENFIWTELWNFLARKTCHLVVIDSNYHGKTFRYHLIGGSCLEIMRNYVIDVEVLRMSRVSMELWIIKVSASDMLALKLASFSTVDKLCFLKH